MTKSLTPKKRKFPSLSLLLLLASYISFGWFLSSPDSPGFHFHGVWINVPMVLAVVWIWIICLAFLNPISSLSHLIVRWFKSDTVAFMSIFLFAGMATLILFWLQIFLYILTIIAAEALARVDFRSSGYSNGQAFLGLLVVSLVGLIAGWGAHFSTPLVLDKLF